MNNSQKYHNIFLQQITYALLKQEKVFLIGKDRNVIRIFEKDHLRHEVVINEDRQLTTMQIKSNLLNNMLISEKIIIDLVKANEELNKSLFERNFQIIHDTASLQNRFDYRNEITLITKGISDFYKTIDEHNNLGYELAENIMYLSHICEN